MSPDKVFCSLGSGSGLAALGLWRQPSRSSPIRDTDRGFEPTRRRRLRSRRVTYRIDTFDADAPAVINDRNLRMA
jgi:hypothetical protein